MQEISVIGCINEPEKDLEAVVELIKAGSIKGIVDSVIPLENAGEAYHRMDEPEFFGKIILSIP